MYIAHFNHEDKSRPHYLNDHVHSMRKMIRKFTSTFDMYGLAEASVVLHDVGKKSKQFQEYVQNPNGKRGTVQHSIGGAYALSRESERLSSEENYISVLIQLIVAGHHVGLSNRDKNFFDKYNNIPDELRGIEKLAANEVKTALSLIDGTYITKYRANHGDEKFNLYISTLARLSMSALVDADYLDTEAYFSDDKARNRIYEEPSFSVFKNLFTKYVDGEFAHKKNEDKLNEIKWQVQNQANETAKKNHTYFTLHAPTGTGKTIAALQFALQHAKQNNKSRIITALPLTNLTEETSSIYRDIFGSDHVVEDHSSIPLLENTDQSPVRLAAENWDRKFIVTTTVQLFESLFHARPMKLRKLHRLANSIIILDEYHKLPHHVLEPIFQQLDILQTHFNVTVLLMSATPFPLFESKAIEEMNLLNKPIEITDYEELFRKVPMRVTYEWEKTALSLEEVAKRLSNKVSVLTVVNTRKEAQELHELLEKENHSFEKVYHLSTTMCSLHREQVLREIKSKRHPNHDRPIAVISTSILEAGVDISFPVVFRMLAPLDAVVQAAGRCNRYGEIEMGRVVLFENKKASPLDDSFKAGIPQTEQLLKAKGVEHFSDPSLFSSYYKRIFSNKSLNKLNIVESNCLEFKDVSTRFKMIEDHRISVVCKMFKGFKKEWLNEKKSPKWWRKIQPFTVSVPAYTREYEEINDIKVWTGTYDQTYGIKL